MKRSMTIKSFFYSGSYTNYFSVMKFVKNELRNKMGGEWLNHRMVCYIERDVFSNKDDDISYHFQELKSRDIFKVFANIKDHN